MPSRQSLTRVRNWPHGEHVVAFDGVRDTPLVPCSRSASVVQRCRRFLEQACGGAIGQRARVVIADDSIGRGSSAVWDGTANADAHVNNCAVSACKSSRPGIQ